MIAGVGSKNLGADRDKGILALEAQATRRRFIW